MWFLLIEKFLILMICKYMLNYNVLLFIYIIVVGDWINNNLCILDDYYIVKIMWFIYM